MSALATPAQLGAYINETIDNADPSALLMLDIASGMVRDYLQQLLDPTVNDVAVLDPIAGAVFLPEFPVTSVSLVETFDGTVWNIMDAATYSVSTRMGIVSVASVSVVSWPYTMGSWRVTYSHGYNTIPMSIVGVVLGVAARAYSTPPGVDLERIGGYQVKYTMEADGFTPIEQKALNRYVNPRIA